MKNKGFSLLETMIALAVAVGAVLWIKDQVLAVLWIQNIIQDRNYLQNLENDLRIAIQSEKGFEVNTAADPALQACLKADQKLCSNTGELTHLVNANRKPVTGGFAGPGKSCSGTSCPVQITVLLSGTCATPAEGCDVARSLMFDYTISVDGAPYRRGFVQKLLKEGAGSDSNSACPMDDEDRTGFAFRISSGQVACLNPDRPIQKITGLKPGSCVGGKEILSGFRANGTPICTKINWE